MESSAVVAFRALIMLACLVLVPLAAIFGSAFPEVVKANLVDRFWPGHKQQVAHSSTGEAPRFGDSTALNNGPAVGSQVNSAETAVWPPNASVSAGNVRAVGTERGSETTRATPAQFSAPAESTPPAWPPAGTGYLPTKSESPFDQAKQNSPAVRPAPRNRLASGNPLASSERLTSGESQPPAGRPAEADRTTPAETDGLAGQQSPRVRGQSQDRPSAYGRVIDNPHAAGQREVSPARPAAAESADFKATERRLRQYGAAYYRLETVGKDGLEYRFYCMMPAGGGVQNPRHFEAVDADPLTAMTRVADDVQVWLERR